MWRKRALSRLVLILAVLLAACSRRTGAEADIEAIRAVIEQTQTANNRGDVEGWTALFDDSAVYMPPGQASVTSRNALREVARVGFTNWRTQVRITPDEIVADGDWAFARNRVTGTTTPAAGGQPIAIDGKQIVLYRRQPDGSWKIARLIANSNGQ
jgi:uncharacterized protein (TIGR02246 family)